MAEDVVSSKGEAPIILFWLMSHERKKPRLCVSWLDLQLSEVWAPIKPSVFSPLSVEAPPVILGRVLNQLQNFSNPGEIFFYPLRFECLRNINFIWVLLRTGQDLDSEKSLGRLRLDGGLVTRITQLYCNHVLLICYCCELHCTHLFLTSVTQDRLQVLYKYILSRQRPFCEIRLGL